MGTLGSRPQLSGLVVKKTDLDTSIQRGGAPPLPGRFGPLAACSAAGSQQVVLLCQEGHRGEVCPQLGLRREGLEFPFLF